MLYQATKKVPGGKLVRVKIEADETISKIQISGDFFLHPEESLPEIEKQLLGLPKNSTPQQFADKIHEGLAAQKAAFIGVTPEDIAQTIQEAVTPQV